jgi:preprotein translocase subunit SecE
LQHVGSTVMSNQAVEQSASAGQWLVVAVAALVAAAGVAGFSFFSDQPTVVRVLILLGGLIAGLVIAWFSVPGRNFISFARDSYAETRRVVWPSRKETLQTTGIVFAFAALMSIFLWLTDKSVEWALYDLLLGWKK